MTGFSSPASISYRMSVSASIFSVDIADTRSCRPPSSSALIALGDHEIHFQRIFPTTTRTAPERRGEDIMNEVFLSRRYLRPMVLAGSLGG